MNLNEIKKALSKASPSSWFQEFAESFPNDLNARIIINAPQWLASLIEHYEECRDDALILDKQVKELQQTNAQIIRTADVIDARNQDLIRQVEEMQKTLENAKDDIRSMKNDYPNELWTHQERESWEQVAEDGIASIDRTLQSLKEDKP